MELLRHAGNSVPYYRKRLKDIAWQSGEPLDDEIWRRVPLLRREEIPRFVGGKFEDEKALSRVFGRFGEVIQATVRHRIDDSGANTSWALVTMVSVGAVESALAAAESLPKPITITRFSQKQASASKGAMGSIQKQVAAKQMSVLHISDISARAMRR